MTRYRILTNRKRAIIALVHTVVFLGVSLTGFITVVRPLEAGSPAPAWILAGVYLVVTAVLLALTRVSRNAIERLYFGLCTTSAGFGLLRQTLGDGRIHAAVYVRVAMMAGAVAVGTWIVRRHGPAPPRAAEMSSRAAGEA